MEALVPAALARMRELVPCQQAFVTVFNVETGTALVVAGSALEELQPPEGTKMPLSDFALQEIFPQEIRYVEDIAAAQSCPLIVKNLRSAGINSCLCVPMLVKETLIGELNLGAPQTAAFTSEHRQIASEVAAQLAIAIQQSQLRSQLQSYASELEQRVADRTAALEETNAELEAFTYSVSHDLRAPLRTMEGFAQALLEDYSDRLDAVGQEYSQYIIEGALQMDTLITDLLAYSRLSRTEIQLQPVDLTSVVEEALKQLAAQMQEQQAIVTVAQPLPQVMAHRPILVQIVTNLLSNAIEFVGSDVQPRVRVWSEERRAEDARNVSTNLLASSIAGSNSESQPLNAFPGKWIRLWIVDNGIGIAPKYQERIFRVFERLHGVETYPGTGIGLAIVRKGMERLGGRVGVESQPGLGSRFWIELPKAGAEY
jgi:signal transduction histidine kinase